MTTIDPAIIEAATKRAAACKPSKLRDAVLANLKANAFVDAEHIEANVADLERESKEKP